MAPEPQRRFSPLVRATVIALLVVLLDLLMPGARNAAVREPTRDQLRDQEVVQVVLLDLLVADDFRVEGSKQPMAIVLTERRAQLSSLLSNTQLDIETRPEVIPAELKQAIQERNGQLPDNLKGEPYWNPKWRWDPKIIVADLPASAFQSLFERPTLTGLYPTAKGWVKPFLPSYSADGKTALVRAFIGPTYHGATANYVLERRDERWMVKWRKLYYLL